MKKFLVFIQALLIYPFLALPAFAQFGLDPCTQSSGNPFSTVLCGISGTNTAITIRNIIVAIVVIAVVIALFYLLWGGIKWITSGGDKEKVEAARNQIVASIVGLIVIFLAVFIISFILQAFGLSFTQLIIPKITP